MVLTLDLVLLILAFVFFILAAWGTPSKIGLGWLGLALWVLTLIV